MRALWLLPKAAPALLRHFAAYVELAVLDLARAQREISAQLIAAVVMGVCILFTILFGCIGLIAYTWDGPYRVATIAWMVGTFLLLTIISAVILTQRSKARSPFLADLQREWAEDRVLFEQILADDDEKP